MFEFYVLHQKATAKPFSIICVPAIGADARTTWSGKGEDGIGWLGLLQNKVASANILLYDHLKAWERALELKDARDAATAKEFAAAETVLASYGVEDYAHRFHTLVEQYRRSCGVGETRPPIKQSQGNKLIEYCEAGTTTNCVNMP